MAGDRERLALQFLQRTRDLEQAQRVLATNRFRRAVRPKLQNAPKGKCILVFGPHPDDEIIGCGGTFIHALRAGARIQTVYLTDGVSPRLEREERARRARLRRDEANSVWKALGGDAPVFWDLPCRALPLDESVIERVQGVFERVRPDTVFVPFFLEDPEDHRKVGYLLWLAHQAQKLPSVEVWSYQVTTMICPNVAVDITEVEPRKYELMQMWVSQNQEFDYAHRARGLNAANSLYVQGLLTDRPRASIELFLVLPTAEYMDLIGHYFGAAPAEGCSR